MTWWHGLVLLAASGAAGAVNAVAGGGTLITFPTLIWLGMPSLGANATSTVGLVPGALSSGFGYRRELRDGAGSLGWLIPVSLAGGALGALILTWTPAAVFDVLAPLLVLAATTLFILQGPISRRLEGQGARSGQRWIVAGCQFLIAIYGGYFGAGMGILMLAALGLLRLASIHQANGLKTLSGACVNGIASAVFVARGLVDGTTALTMAVGSTLGGYLAADAARKLGQGAIRAIVIAIGLIATLVLAAQRFL